MINIYNKHKFTNDKNLLELIINLYLMESAYRNLFQIIINDKKEKIAKLINIIKKTDYNYEIFETDNYLRLIVYKQNKFDINKLDKTFSAKFAKQLGKFYVCASNNYRSYNYQIMIYVQNKNVGFPIYVQMCKKSMMIKNMDNILKIFNDVKKILLNLDNNINVLIQIEYH